MTGDHLAQRDDILLVQLLDFVRFIDFEAGTSGLAKETRPPETCACVSSDAARDSRRAR